MELAFSAEELGFRDEVRAFIAENLPESVKVNGGRYPHWSKEDVVAWQRILNAKGWATPHWPAEHGGTNWSAVQRYIFMEELLRAPTPEPLSFNVNMVGPVLCEFGNEEQKKFFLPKVANLDIWFCQGFSEPGAGSDLASLRTSAVRDGDDYIVNGQKIWTSTAHKADWIFALVRTDPDAPKRQMGISFLLIDMKTPGITVRGIKTIDEAQHVNEVFFEDVRVPANNRIGEENKGWDYAKFLLGNERTGIARVGLSRQRLNRARALAEKLPGFEGMLCDDPQFRRKCATVEMKLKSLEITVMRVIDRQRRRNDSAPDPATSMLKLRGAEIQQQTAELMADVAGPMVAPTSAIRAAYEGDFPAELEETMGIVPHYFNSRAASIYGGTNEIQRNIIAKGVLGL
jgi:alkylation response protein AidB-like acyl-CoA dehydrogenase